MELTSIRIETTCLDVERARIVQYTINEEAPVNVAGGESEPSAFDVHGLDGTGVPTVEALSAIMAAIYGEWSKGGAIVAYNAPFVLTVIDRELKRANCERLSIRGLVVDPFVLDKGLDPYRRGSRRMPDVLDHYGVSCLRALAGRMVDRPLPKDLMKYQADFRRVWARGLSKHLGEPVDASWPVKP